MSGGIGGISPRRLAATLRWNVVLQFRHGFYYVSAAFILVRVALLRQLPGDAHMSLLVPGLMVNNLIITTFYFVGALVLLEKGEGTLAGLVVTPLRDTEYFLGKVFSLTLLGVGESLTIVLLTDGTRFNLLLLVGGMALLCGFYTLAGFVAVARFDSLNEYLLPSVLIVMALWLPLLDHFGLVHSPLFYLHPVQPALVLMRAAFAPAQPWEIVYGVAGSLFWLGLSLLLARRSFARFVVRAAGT
jgi:fluoroquinolone transport system permease protein